MQLAVPVPGKYKEEIYKTGSTDLHTRTHPSSPDTALTLFYLHLFDLPAFVSAFNMIATIFEKDTYGFRALGGAGVTHTHDSRFEREHGHGFQGWVLVTDAARGLCSPPQSLQTSNCKTL